MLGRRAVGPDDGLERSVFGWVWGTTGFLARPERPGPGRRTSRPPGSRSRPAAFRSLPVPPEHKGAMVSVVGQPYPARGRAGGPARRCVQSWAGVGHVAIGVLPRRAWTVFPAGTRTTSPESILPYPAVVHSGRPLPLAPSPVRHDTGREGTRSASGGGGYCSDPDPIGSNGRPGTESRAVGNYLDRTTRRLFWPGEKRLPTALVAEHAVGVADPDPESRPLPEPPRPGRRSSGGEVFGLADQGAAELSPPHPQPPPQHPPRNGLRSRA